MSDSSPTLGRFQAQRRLAFSDAIEFASRIGDLVSRREVGPLMLSSHPAEAPGDVGKIVLLAPHKGRWRAVGVVSDLTSTRTVVLMGARAGRPALVGHPEEEGAERVADAIAEYVRGGALDAVRLNALDAALLAGAMLKQNVSVDGGRWRFQFWGEWDAHASGASVELGGPAGVEWRHLVRITQADDGVSFRIPEEAMGRGDFEKRIQAFPDLFDEVPPMIDRVRRALRGRETFARRPLPIDRAGDLLVRALQGRIPGRLSLQVGASEFPLRYSAATVWRTDGVGPHACISLTESSEGVRVVAGRFEGTYRSPDALEAALNGIRDAVEEELGRLTPDKLEPGRIYRVKRSFSGAEAGASLRFVHAEHVLRGSWSLHHFRVEETGADLTLDDSTERGRAILRALHEYLI